MASAKNITPAEDDALIMDLTKFTEKLNKQECWSMVEAICVLATKKTELEVFLRNKCQDLIQRA